jgi:hypothetical protein
MTKDIFLVAVVPTNIRYFAAISLCVQFHNDRTKGEQMLPVGTLIMWGGRFFGTSGLEDLQWGSATTKGLRYCRERSSLYGIGATMPCVISTFAAKSYAMPNNKKHRIIPRNDIGFVKRVLHSPFTPIVKRPGRLAFLALITIQLAFGVASAQTATVSEPRQKPNQIIEKLSSLILLNIDAVQRSGPPPTTVFIPPAANVLYDSASVVVTFTLSNHSGHSLTGRITGNFGGPLLTSAYPVKGLANGASVHATLALGQPPSAGQETITLVYQEQQAPSSRLVRGAWQTMATANQEINVLTAPSYVRRAPYDLVSETLDSNGFPMNPRWGKQDEYFFRTGSRDLWVAQARPDILRDCFNNAEHQDIGGVDNDYDAFRNGYCRHSPGATNLIPFYCRGDQEVTTQPSGPIYCSSFAWKDSPMAAKCANPPLGSGNMNDITQDGGFAVTFHNAGHENFGLATYDGIANWDNAQAEWEGDSDWDINLYTQNGAGVTGRKDGVQFPEEESFVHTEFDPKNVGDDWDGGFWGQLAHAIHSNQQSFGSGSCLDVRYCQGTTDNENRVVAPMINGHRAIVLGLLGLDLGHNDAQSELHPVYAMAIHTGGRPLANSGCNWNGPWQGHCNISADAYKHPEKDPYFDVPKNLTDDTWAIFATNFGNEGYCSTRALHVLDGDESIIGRKDFPTFTVLIPWAKDESGKPMASVEILDTTNFALHAQVDIGRRDAIFDTHVEEGSGILVTFHMWPSRAQSNFFGELHLRWKRVPGTFIAHLPALTLTPANSSGLMAHRETDLMSGSMSKEQVQLFMAEWMKNAKAAPPAQAARLSIAASHQHAPPPPPPMKVTLPVHTAIALSPRSVEEDTAQRKALCAAHGGQVPKAPADFCKQ